MPSAETNISSATETDILLQENAVENETLIFNVGGVIFETYRSTLKRMQSGPLTDSSFLEAVHRPDKNDYFLDRDPDAFKILLNFLRTGLVTIPAYIDSPSIRNELVFLGLRPDLEVTISGESSWIGPAALHSASSHVNRDIAIETGALSKIWNILSNPETSVLAKIYAGISYFMMCLSVFILVAETTTLLKNDHIKEAVYISIACCLFFSVEYILRLIFSPNKILFLLSLLAIIDVLAILPNLLTLLSFLFVADLRILRILSVFRILRLLRIFKHFKEMFGTDVIVNTLKSCFGQIIGLFFLTFILVLLWGTLAYGIDFSGEYDEWFDNIPLACWWAVITMTTVGYGDIVPFTVQGKLLASVCTLSGLMIIALLVSVVVTGMVECSRKNRNSKRKKLI